MPFTAIDTTTGQRIDITKIQYPRKVLTAGKIVCPVCGSPMFIRGGQPNLRTHFVHNKGREDCEYAIYSRGETPEHLAAKLAIRDNLALWFSEYDIATPEIEVTIPEVKHAHHRIADVMFTFPSGWRVAHEVQLASITLESLQQRTEDYAEAGVDVFWWFGREALRQRGVQEWSMDNYGFLLQVQWQTSGTTDEVVLYADDIRSGFEGYSNQKPTGAAM